MKKILFLLCCIVVTITLSSCASTGTPANITNDAEAILVDVDLDSTQENLVNIVDSDAGKHYIFNSKTDGKILEVFIESGSSSNNTQEVTSNLIVLSDNYSENVYTIDLSHDSNKEYIFVNSKGENVVKLVK